MDLRNETEPLHPPPQNHFCCCAPNIDGVVDEVADDPKGDDCGVVVAGGCPNPNGNAPVPPVPETGVLLGVVVVGAGNENLGVVLVSPLGALVVRVDPFPNTLLGGSVELPNTPLLNTFEVRVCCCCIPKGEGLVPVLFENAVVVFVLPSPNTDL